jgi:AcrR family transcriptional regulator
VFAEDGYVGASARRIAGLAGVAPPAVQYHFDGKEGLHRACGQAIVERALQSMARELADGRSALALADKSAKADALRALIVRAADLAMRDSDPEPWSQFFRRCQADQVGPAAEVVQQGFGIPLAMLVSALFAGAAGLEPESNQARVRAALLLSQLTYIHKSAKSNSSLGKSWDKDSQADLLDIFADNVRRLLAP